MRRLALLPLLILSACASAPAPADPGPDPLVVLLTDFGLEDDAIGLMRGVIHSVAPRVQIADLCHEVPVFDVEQGARLLVDGPGVYPERAVFCVVVDPGVGTARRAIVATLNNGRRIVAPDNGVISGVAEAYGVREVREVTNRSLMLPEMSSTFHGRDVFAPVAAHVAGGVPLSEVGPVITDWIRLEPKLARVEGKTVFALVEALDQPFGNVLTNAEAALLEGLGAKQGSKVRVRFGKRSMVLTWVNTFGDVPEGKPLLYVNSRGKLSLALNRASFAETHGVSRGTPVTLELAR